MELDFSALSPAERYKLLTSVVVPRPIAWVTTLSLEGALNAAPFSFFNVFGSNPGMVILGIGNRPDGTPKDTVLNIRSRGEFVVNMVNEALAAQMVQTAAPLPHGVDELTEAGLATAPSRRVSPPRIAASPVSLECGLLSTQEIGGNRIIIGEIHHAAIDDRLYDRDTGYVRAEELRLIGRMHGSGGYIRSSDYFEIERPS